MSLQLVAYQGQAIKQDLVLQDLVLEPKQELGLAIKGP